jgi:hypothetical protein
MPRDMKIKMDECTDETLAQMAQDECDGNQVDWKIGGKKRGC